jgi:hypothetical protein
MGEIRRLTQVVAHSQTGRAPSDTLAAQRLTVVDAVLCTRGMLATPLRPCRSPDLPRATDGFAPPAEPQ